MTRVMCRDHPDARVTGMAVIGGSDGSHERRRLALKYNDAGEAAGLPSHVFTKTLASLLTRMLGGFMGHARYEMLFYTRLRPLLHALRSLLPRVLSALLAARRSLLQ